MGGAVDDPKPPGLGTADEEGAADAQKPGKVGGTGCDCCVVETPKVEVDPSGALVVFESNAPELAGLPKDAGAVEEPKPPVVNDVPNVDSVLV